ncbi:hypothetical protein [Natrarchaeobaculum aegyptiacum]|uniref:Uncharacterized protein n=1 Tax=Natrarchaeobaculum aegyptiacum TaxID=745377 RepID=A0A2Z2HRN0_9EURY|nr:hypothetical protein [Natrarchaeobaculum aegyptiacum]ARS89816.1 hypothetical protein B1756_08735 [Natrarchaeobaculum aegyptiacum]
MGDQERTSDVLERDDLTQKQREEIAETLSTRAITFDVESSVFVRARVKDKSLTRLERFVTR